MSRHLTLFTDITQVTIDSLQVFAVCLSASVFIYLPQLVYLRPNHIQPAVFNAISVDSLYVNNYAVCLDWQGWRDSHPFIIRMTEAPGMLSSCVIVMYSKSVNEYLILPSVSTL